MNNNIIDPTANEIEAIHYTAAQIDLFGADVFSNHVGAQILTEEQCDAIWEAAIPHYPRVIGFTEWMRDYVNYEESRAGMTATAILGA